MTNLIRLLHKKILETVYRSIRKEMLQNWNRCLPFSDLFVDRWEKASILKFGKGTSIYDSAHVFGDVSVGENTWIGPFTVLDGVGGLSIGSNCSISAGVQIYSHDTANWAVSGGVASYEYSPVFIGDNCYIGPQTVITKGVTIGSGSIIGAGSIVLESIPPGSKAVGSPCKVISSLDPKSEIRSIE
jgi:acetyltransferase-like isoleucine patch superfamily enzyme